MKIIIASDKQKMSEIAADILASLIKEKPSAVLGLATGSTPLGIYQRLITKHQNEGLDFSKITTFNLDEYLGLSPQHPQSYNYFMQENLFRHVNLDPSRIFVPRGDTPKPKDFCLWYEEQIKRAGGIDLQLLGIGSDGHIAFNEPGSSLASRTRVVALYKQTIEDNARFFKMPEEVPRFAITMGVGTILEARRILLVANGSQKAEACAKFIEGPITNQITASSLQLHPKVTVVLDEDAAALLKNKDYYKWIQEQAPYF